MKLIFSMAQNLFDCVSLISILLNWRHIQTIISIFFWLWLIIVEVWVNLFFLRQASTAPFIVLEALQQLLLSSTLGVAGHVVQSKIENWAASLIFKQLQEPIKTKEYLHIYQGSRTGNNSTENGNKLFVSLFLWNFVLEIFSLRCLGLETYFILWDIAIFSATGDIRNSKQ